VNPLRYYLAHLKRAVKDAERVGVRLRAGGSGHSFNDVACSNGYLVDIGQLNKPLELPAYLKPEHRERCTRAQNLSKPKPTTPKWLLI